MNIKPKATALLISVTAMTALVAARSSYSGNLAIVEAAEQHDLHSVAIFIQNGIEEQSSRAAARASLVASLPSIQEAFRAQDRDQLVHRLAPAFIIQRDRYGVREGQFHLAPAISFLRVFDPTAGHGEDLSSFREMVVLANRRQEAQRGVEIGRRGLSIRGVEVVRDAQGPIGSFEVGMSFSTILAAIRQSTGYEAGVFVDDQRMATVATLIPRPDRERVVGGFQNVESTNWQAIRVVVTPDLLTRSHEVTTRVVTDPTGESRGLVLVPLRDFKNVPIGAVIASRSFATYQTQTRRALATALAYALLQSMLLVGAMLLILNGMLLRPLAVLAEKLRDLAAGHSGSPITALARQPDEVGSMARDIDAVAGVLRRAGATTEGPPDA